MSNQGLAETKCQPRRLSILVCWQFYWPDFLETGPRISIDSMMAGLGPSVAFKVIGGTRNEDAPVPWRQTKLCSLRQLPRDYRLVWRLRQELEKDDSDAILLCSFFDAYLSILTLLLMRFGLTRRRPVILSPRGEFSPGALSLKAAQKRFYLLAARLLGLHRDVWFHATCEEEARLIRAQALPCRDILVAHDTSMLMDLPPHVEPQAGAPLRIALLSRVDPKKNVDFAIETVARLTHPATMTIYGPISDEVYWSRCQRLMANLPPHVRVDYGGPVAHQEVPAKLAAHDLFFLPTRGENFGHVIHEALMSGTPVLISDQTPWRGLEQRRAGWVLPLDEPQAFARTIDAFAALSPEQRQVWRDGARAFAEERFHTQASIEETRRMFETVIAGWARKRCA